MHLLKYCTFSRRTDTAPVMRRRGFESHPVLSVFDHSASVMCAHVVVVAYCLAKAEARVRLPLGTSFLAAPAKNESR